MDQQQEPQPDPQPQPQYPPQEYVHPDTRALKTMGVRFANAAIADAQFRAKVDEIRDMAYEIGFHVDEAGTAKLDPRQVNQIQGLLARLFSLE